MAPLAQTSPFLESPFSEVNFFCSLYRNVPLPVSDFGA